jgi:hypothetical protein
MLNDSELFTMESCDLHTQLLQLEVELIKAKQEIDRKNIVIYGHIVEGVKRDMKLKEEQILSKNVAIENVKLRKNQVKEQIAVRLNLPEKSSWGYKPDTLEVIIDEN